MTVTALPALGFSNPAAGGVSLSSSSTNRRCAQQQRSPHTRVWRKSDPVNTALRGQYDPKDIILTDGSAEQENEWHLAGLFEKVPHGQVADGAT